MAALVSVVRVFALCNPFRTPPWDCGRLSVSEVRRFIREGHLLERPVWPARPERDQSAEHLARIAYLAVHGWPDPIQIDVGVPYLRCYPAWPVLDGNHRLAAALVRRQLRILASIGGDLDYAGELFNIDPDTLLEATPQATGVSPIRRLRRTV